MYGFSMILPLDLDEITAALGEKPFFHGRGGVHVLG
jgi:hypothetical protein